MYEEYLNERLSNYFAVANLAITAVYMDKTVVVASKYRGPYKEGVKVILPFYLDSVPISIACLSQGKS